MNKFLILPLALGIAYQGQAFPVKKPFSSIVGSSVFQDQIKGTVVANNGVPVSGVTVKNVQSGKTAVTDARGQFQLSAKQGETLRFSSVGYKSLDQQVTGNSLSVTLTEDSSQLEEVVVVGYGTQRKSTVSGAVATTDLKGTNSRSMAGIGEVLQGRTPGVTVTAEGGDPTSKPSINIRGMGGLNGQQPVYVIDGVIFNGVPDLNPNDIQDISVLKDASAAVYGARASGGIILVTTKSGKAGELKIDFEAKYGLQKAHNLLQSLNAADRAMISNQAADNAGVARDPAFDASKYPDGQITRTNWVDEIFRTARTQDYNLSASAGNEKSSFYTGFNYRNAEGILINTYGKRYNFRINSQTQLTPWLKLGENISYSFTNGQGANTSSGYTGAVLSAIHYPRNVSVYDDAGKFSGLPEKYGPGSYGDVINPVAYLSRLDVDNPVHNLLINPYVELKLLPGLKFRSNFAYTKQFTDFKEFTARIPEIGKPNMSNSLTIRTERSTDILAEQTLTYEKDFGKHHIEGLAGFMYQQTKMNYQYVIGENFDDEAKNYRYLVNAGRIQPVDDGLGKTALLSYLLRANYNYDNRYMLTLIGRRDGTSLVAKENQFQNYGSVSGAWAIHREAFLSDSEVINTLKLRVSYGILGDLATLPSTAVSPLLKRVDAWFGKTPALLPGYIQEAMGNPNLTWAESKQTNIGLDLGILNNRLTLNADYFVKNTSNMIMQITLPGTTGVKNKYVNGGLVRDKGLEIALNYSSKADAAFQYDVRASVNKITNNVESLIDQYPSIPSQVDYRGILKPLRTEPGQALYSYYGLETAGLFRSNQEAEQYKNSAGTKIQPNAQAGDMKFVDQNGDGIIDAKDRVFLGSAYPDFNYGVTFNGSYKNFDVNIFFQGVQGNKLFNALKYTGLNAASGQPYNMFEEIKNAYSESNPNSDIPRVSVKDLNGNFSNVSDFYIENGSYLRLKNLIVGYTLPRELTQRYKIQKLRFFASATNLFTVTKYTGMDPEVGINNYGVDAGRYPQSRTFLFGAAVTF
ncbi:SusC/RagA family TonB-linked outer membrane protein [Sphingobacterium detergens]|uniref:TonB-linked SusC/RagA family outer membrane protein n=1 Tax=Sphingobacterium detergens TaxID=1145106 RepID=A0A420AIJ2_SPHD1|nr:TonB-dependent receptor [Sphingobacterium detergens]RKE44324.1 TonB-linked SusC/RagA family outer membrane protein [Sphingobacterium detergens]